MQRMCQAVVVIAACCAAGTASAHRSARVAIGFGFPAAGPVYVAPPPVYYVQPQVVYVMPPPVYAQPAYVYYGAPVTVYRPAPGIVNKGVQRRHTLPHRSQPEQPPALPPRPYRN